VPTPTHVLARRFVTDSDLAWQHFEKLPDWEARDAVVQALRAAGSGESAATEEVTAWSEFCRLYRRRMDGIICEEFYSLDPHTWQRQYLSTGEISVPFLTESGAAKLAARSEELEPNGKRRYREPRPTYPPGEVFTYDDDDPRKSLWTEVNMTAIGMRHMADDDGFLWVYHSPHLNRFLSVVVGCAVLYPYLRDLGIQLNLARPFDGAKMSTGWHFDSIDSSGGAAKAIQPRGVTGVIGLQDCLEGGERVVFPGVHRAQVDVVGDVLAHFDPLRPELKIGTAATPSVCRGRTSQTLYLFNGGHVLHGVCPVRRGARIAAAFLMREERPNESDATQAESAKYFCDRETSNEQARKRQKKAS